MLKMKKSRNYLSSFCISPFSMKIVLILMIFAVSPLFLTAGESKTVYIPDNISVEENAFKATAIRNMSDIIYSAFGMRIIDDFIYLLDYKIHSIVKLSLQGKVVRRFGKKGEGPGELLALTGINRFKDNIAFTDKYKVIICNKDLQYLREIKLKQRFHYLILSTDNKIYFYNNPSWSNYYFTVYTKDFKNLKKFGIKKPVQRKLRKRKSILEIIGIHRIKFAKLFMCPKKMGFGFPSGTAMIFDTIKTRKRWLILSQRFKCIPP